MQHGRRVAAGAFVHPSAYKEERDERHGFALSVLELFLVHAAFPPECVFGPRNVSTEAWVGGELLANGAVKMLASSGRRYQNDTRLCIIGAVTCSGNDVECWAGGSLSVTVQTMCARVVTSSASLLGAAIR